MKSLNEFYKSLEFSWKRKSKTISARVTLNTDSFVLGSKIMSCFVDVVYGYDYFDKIECTIYHDESKEEFYVINVCTKTRTGIYKIYPDWDSFKNFMLNWDENIQNNETHN